MKKEHLIDFLNKGKLFGVQFNSADSNYIGWIEVTKNFANQRILDLFADEPNSLEYKTHKLNLEKPFYVRVAELLSDVYERKSDPLDKHYKRNDVYRFYNIYEVEEFLQIFEKELTDLMWYADFKHD